MKFQSFGDCDRDSDHLPLAELKRLARVEKNADRARRLRIIILSIEGWTAPVVASAVGLHGTLANVGCNARGLGRGFRGDPLRKRRSGVVHEREN